MEQWEFVQVLRQCDQVFVVPPGKIDLRWIRQKCPQSQLCWDEDSSLDQVNFPTKRDAGECYAAVLEYAGSQGWQPFASEYIVGQSVSLRRSTSLAY